MNYAEAKRIKANAAKEVDIANEVWTGVRGSYTVGNSVMGLTPDYIKFQPDYKEASDNYWRAFRIMQDVNQWFNREFKKEYAAERVALRKEKELTL